MKVPKIYIKAVLLPILAVLIAALVLCVLSVGG